MENLMSIENTSEPVGTESIACYPPTAMEIFSIPEALKSEVISILDSARLSSDD
jgi:hypothetical protein